MLELRTSASQLQTFHSCPRAWWLGKVAKAPQPFDRKLLVGEVGHEVLERFLRHQFLYPKGWTSPLNRFTKQKSEHHITTTEQALIKALVTKAIEENKIRREPDGEVEKEFGKKLGVIQSVEGVAITLLGFIDYTYGNNIDDHKFTSAPRYYGVDKLKKAFPMNLYAWAGYEEGFITDPTVWLRYNVFKKDTVKPEVLIKHVERTKEEIYEFYAHHIRPLLKPMALAFKNCTTWEQIDNAMCRGEANQVCKKYGGCPYLDICLGKVTLDGYKARFEKTNLGDKKKSQSDILDKIQNKHKKEEKKMSSKGFLSKLKDGPSIETPAETSAETSAETPVETPKTNTDAPTPAVETGTGQRAPWAFDGCPVCARAESTVAGMTAKGEPCNICVMTTNSLRETDPDQEVLEDYEVSTDDQGIVSWVKKATEKGVATTVTAQPIKKPPVVKEKVVSKGGDTFPVGLEKVPEEATDPKKFPAIEEPSTEPPQDIKKEEIKPSKEGFNPSREAYNQERTGTKGFILSYVSVRSNRKSSKKLGEANCIVHIAELAELVSIKLLELANQQGAGAAVFSDIDYFVRRDLIQTNAKAIAELVGNSVVDASNIIEASVEHLICAAIDRYASIIFGSHK